MKLAETEVRAPETKPSKEGNEMLPFATQYHHLVSTVKEALMEEWNLYKTNRSFANFLKNHTLFSTRNENHDKEHAC